jgi:ATP synthase protein I
MPSDNNSPPNLPSNEPRSPAAEKARDASNTLVTALELPFVFVGAVVLGGFLGYLLDGWLHTKPVFLILLGIAGFAAGIRDVLRRMPSK